MPAVLPGGGVTQGTYGESVGWCLSGCLAYLAAWLDSWSNWLVGWIVCLFVCVCDVGNGRLCAWVWGGRIGGSVAQGALVGLACDGGTQQRNSTLRF